MPVAKQRPRTASPLLKALLAAVDPNGPLSAAIGPTRDPFDYGEDLYYSVLSPSFVNKTSNATELFEKVSQNVKVKNYSEALVDINATIDVDQSLSEAFSSGINSSTAMKLA
ncbi:hypothetical protein G4B88_011135 [Cannabis sativa]|uniref:Uncharacterized protein n=1 Tax=Cannabis sativa TaxID=3483 RepID=A0A7J6HHA7_CANSA|nr:hypothetical protein G4B88_011135 [Cannabis sativa]